MPKILEAAVAVAASALTAAFAVRFWKLRSKKSIVLTYLDIPGIAEPIRLAFALGGVHFVDQRVSYEEIRKMRSRGELPTGQVPVLTVDGEAFGQSGAILRWAGRQSGLYPGDLSLKIDMAEETLNDIRIALRPQWYKNAAGRSLVSGRPIAAAALNEEQQAGVAACLHDDILPQRFAQLERMVRSSGGPFFCGEALTTSDLSLYVMARGLADGTYCDGISPDILSGFPALKNLARSVAERISAAY